MFSNFLVPSALLWLLIIPFIILLYFLKLKREEYVFPSTMLWLKVINDMRVNSPFQRLKNNLLLYLQILLLLLVIFALARPFLAQQALQGRNIVVLLDISASMKSKDESGKSRLDKAKEKIRQIVYDINSDDRMMIITFSSKANICQTFTHLQTKLENVLETIEAVETSTRINEAFDIARAMVEKLISPSIYIFTDGRIENLPEIINSYSQQKGAITPQIVICGTSADNVGIVSLDVKKSPLKQSHQAYVQVQNFSAKRAEVILEIAINNHVLMEDVRLLDMGGGDVRGVLFEDIQIEEGVVEAKVTINSGKDYLDSDNRAWFVVPPQSKNKICLVSNGNFLLRKVLLSHDPNLKEISLVEYEELFASEEGLNILKTYDVIAFDNIASSKVLPGKGNMFFNCVPKIEGLSSVRETSDEYGFKVVDQNSLHPLMRFVDMRKFALGKMLEISWAEDTVPLLEVQSQTAIGLISRQNTHYLIIGFDIFQSAWPMHISFPIFVANSITWFKEVYNKYNITSSNVTHIQFSRNIEKVKMKTSKDKIKWEDVKNNVLRFSDTEYLGVYDFEGYDDLGDATEKKSIAVNLFSMEESKIEPITELTIKEENIAGRDFLTINQEVWHYFVLIAFFVLLLEWFLFHRRSLSLSILKKKPEPLFSFDKHRKK